MFPVLAARHPDLSDLFVRRWRPKGDSGSCGEQRDLPLSLRPITALLPGQCHRAPGIAQGGLGKMSMLIHVITLSSHESHPKSNRVVSVFVHLFFFFLWNWDIVFLGCPSYIHVNAVAQEFRHWSRSITRLSHGNYSRLMTKMKRWHLIWSSSLQHHNVLQKKNTLTQ